MYSSPATRRPLLRSLVSLGLCGGQSGKSPLPQALPSCPWKKFLLRYITRSKRSCGALAVSWPRKRAGCGMMRKKPSGESFGKLHSAAFRTAPCMAPPPSAPLGEAPWDEQRPIARARTPGPPWPRGAHEQRARGPSGNSPPRLVWEDLTKQHTREQETKVTKRTRKSQGSLPPEGPGPERPGNHTGMRVLVSKTTPWQGRRIAEILGKRCFQPA